MDSEVLAAVAWSRDNLEPGSRISADRVNSTVFAAGAGLWPIIELPAAGTRPRCTSPTTGATRRPRPRAFCSCVTSTSTGGWRMNCRSWVRTSSMGETSGSQQLTDWELTKFDSVPGIALVYRHGPISIYDLKGLGIQELRNGWYGETPTGQPADATGRRPARRIPGGTHAAQPTRGPAAGGHGPAMVRRRRPGPDPADRAGRAPPCSRSPCCCCGIWLTPLSFAIGAAVVLLTNLRPAVAADAHRSWRQVRWRRVAAGTLHGRSDRRSPRRRGQQCRPAGSLPGAAKSWTTRPRFMFRPPGTGAPK